MTEDPGRAARTHAVDMTFRRILATVTDLAILSMSILLGGILIFLCMDLAPFAFVLKLITGDSLFFPLIAMSFVLTVGILYFSPGCRILGLSVKSADGANLSMIRHLWRNALKYVWVLLGILVFLPFTMRPLSEGLALLISTTGTPIFLTAFVLWWVGGPGRSVYDLAAGTVVIQTHPADEAAFLKTWLILWIPVAAQVVVLFSVLVRFWETPWDIPEYEVDWPERRNRRYAETLTNYSLNVLGLTVLTYAVFGWRHRPGRKASNGGPSPAAGDEALPGEGSESGGGQRGDPSQEPFSPQS